MKLAFTSHRGVTLIELMVVIAILAIISAIAIPAYNGYIKEGRKSECRNEVAAISLAQSQFFLENNTYFAGAGVAALQAASGGYYTPTAEAAAAGTTGCTYTVVAGTTGTIASSYTLTATGVNKLSTEGTFITKNGN